ncbi:MAG: ABC transporter substrate-binding protein [Rhodospirillales bacterium]|nr:ABC transporter substrate-binding protein [Rhodospirillales bacterium]
MRLIVLIALLLVSPSALGETTVETQFPALDAQTERLVVFGSTDLVAMAPVIEHYQKENPGTAVEYFEVLSADLYDLVRNDKPLNGRRPDMVISAAMDMQFKLVNDGFAQRHESPQTANLPQWANWRNEAFGFTFEPIVIVYNPKILAAEDVPATRFDLIRLLREKADTYRSKVGSYDITKSGVGYLFATQDALQAHTYGRLLESFGRNDIYLANTTGEVLDAVEKGELLIGHNVLGSYTRLRITQGADLAMVLPADYTLVMSRVAFIHRDAPNEQTARSFLNYLLSLGGQKVLAGKSHLYAIHPQLQGPATAHALRKAATGPLRPIRLGTGLLVTLDKLNRRRFLLDWNRTIGTKGGEQK